MNPENESALTVESSSTPRPPGDFAYRTLIGPVEPDPEATGRPRSHFGLHLHGTYLHGSFRTADGTMHSVLRNVPLTGANSNLLVMNDSTGQLRFDPTRMKPSRGLATRRFEGGAAILEGERAMGQDFVIRQEENSLVWEEGDVFALRGDGAGPGLQWYTPFAGGGGFYHSVPYLAEGTIAGSPVRGFVFLDSLYFPVQYTWGNDPLTTDVLHHWHTFGNLYADGSYEVGLIGHGRMGYGYVMVNDENGNRLCTHPTDSRVKVGEDGWAQSIVTETESETWEWTADKDGRGHMIDFGPIDKPQDVTGQGGSAKYQEEGCYRRQGDERVPIVWSGWGETCGGRF